MINHLIQFASLSNWPILIWLILYFLVIMRFQWLVLKRRPWILMCLEARVCLIYIMYLVFKTHLEWLFVHKWIRHFLISFIQMQWAHILSWIDWTSLLLCLFTWEGTSISQFVLNWRRFIQGVHIFWSFTYWIYFHNFYQFNLSIIPFI